MMTAHAMTNAIELPDHAVARCENLSSTLPVLVERFRAIRLPLAEPGPAMDSPSRAIGETRMMAALELERRR